MHRRVCDQGVFHFLGPNPIARGTDDVIGSADIEKIAAFILVYVVTCFKPIRSIGFDQYITSALRIVPVTQHHLRVGQADKEFTFVTASAQRTVGEENARFNAW